MYDICCSDSIGSAVKYINSTHKFLKKSRIALVGVRNYGIRQVSYEHGKTIAEKYGVEFYEVNYHKSLIINMLWELTYQPLSIIKEEDYAEDCSLNRCVIL